MAESKPEKVDISIQKSSSGNTGNTGSSSAVGPKKQKDPSVADGNKNQNTNSGKNQGTQQKQDGNAISNVTRAYTDSKTSDNQDQKEHKETADSTSIRQRKGEETKLEPLHSANPGSSEESADAAPETRSDANEAEITETNQENTQEQPDESAAEDSQDYQEYTEEKETTDLPDSDFYSSKMDVNQASGEAPRSNTTDKQRKTVSEHFEKILLVFIIAVLAGLIVLYQLEQARPGSGIIFDWLAL